MSQEYGKEVTFQEILELLVLHCHNAGVKNPKVKVVLPKQIIDQFSASLRAKERLGGSESIVSSFHASCPGTVELFNDQDNEVTEK